MKNNTENAIEFLKSRKFFLSLSVVLILVIIAVSVAIYAKETVQNRLEGFTNYYTLNHTEPATQENTTEKVAADLTNVPDERNTDVTKLGTEEFTTGEKIEKTEGFIFPFGKNIIKDYSDGSAVKSKTMNDWRIHNGIDFLGAENDKVVAVQSGSILAINTSRLWGTVVEVDHGNGIVAKYASLKKDTIPEVGSVVKQGDTIGIIDEIPIEKEDGIHLHFEISISGKTVDPLEAMEKIKNEQ